MAISKPSQTNFLLTFKVLQSVNQIRRRIKSRVLDGSSPLGSGALGLRGPKSSTSTRAALIGKHHVSHSDCDRERIGRSRRRNHARRLTPAGRPRASAADISARSDVSRGKVMQLMNAVDEFTGHENGLSAIAGDGGLFLKHDHAPMLEGQTLNQLIQFLITVQEAVNELAICRSEYGDEWLLLQGLNLGLVIDEMFIANYEHLLLRLRGELVEALARKSLEELLRGGHDKRQRKLLAWFSEFAEKPRPLSTSFPWTIKPSLAVLWGVCWMFHDSEINYADEFGARSGNDRVRGDRVLRNLNFPTEAWSAPASSDYMNLGLELIGGLSQHGTQQPAVNNVTEDATSMFQARNADTWESVLSPLENFRLPSSDGQVGTIGMARYGAAPPQLHQNTYYNHDLDHLSNISSVDQFLPHNQGLPLTVLTNTGTNNAYNSFSWRHPTPRNSSPHHSPRHLIQQPAPIITVTHTPDNLFAQPHGTAYPLGGDQSYIYHNPQAPSNTDIPFNYYYSQQDMASQISPDPAPIQLPQQIPSPLTKHERTSSVQSNSGMPTPASIGLRSPLLSPTSGVPSNINTSPHAHSRRVSEDRSSVEDEDENLGRRGIIYKRSEEPPRNTEGKMYCRYQECTGMFFDRKCEWSKHMDKHDRPYKCKVKGCEKLQGFTYSGGLLRHEREVHKMHGGTKKSLFCPFPDCKRSSGAGFTRKENLSEHVRRVHRSTSISVDIHGLIVRRETIDSSPTAESRHTSESPYTRPIEYKNEDESSHKRKRSDTGSSDRGSDDLRAEIKRLKQDNDEKDSRLRQLEQAVMALQRR